MKLLLLSATVAAALLVAPAFASDKAAPPAEQVQAPEADTAKPAADDKVCTLEKSLGSNMKKRVCRTRAQYEAEQASAREALERSQRGGSANR